MPSLPTREFQKKHVRWTPTPQRGSDSTCSSSSSQADSRNSSPALKPRTHDDLRARGTPMKAGVGMIMMPVTVSLIPALHPVLSYFAFNWNVRATQFPDSLPRSARDEPAFPSLPYPMPITIYFDTPLGTSACIINPLQRSDGKPVPINVGRVLACISRSLYTAIEPTALYPSHTLLPAVRKAAESRPYDPEPGRTKRVPRNVDLYPVPSAAQRDAPLFFWYIELQHCVGGKVRLVARFGPKALKAVV